MIIWDTYSDCKQSGMKVFELDLSFYVSGGVFCGRLFPPQDK